MSDRDDAATGEVGESALDEKTESTARALRRLSAAGVDPIIPRSDCLVALNLSAPTVSRMQGRGELPRFAEISPGRKGWRRSVLREVLDGGAFGTSGPKRVIDLHAIARRYGGTVCKDNALIPTPGHSTRDGGTAIAANPFAPDGVLVACYNGTTADALAVKEMLRRDGFLAERSGRGARELTTAERRSIQRAEVARERTQLRLHDAAAATAAELSAGATAAHESHPYLVRKRLKPFGIRQFGNVLLVPIVDAGFRLWNLQRILPNGSKLFGKNGRTKGLFWPHAMHLQDGRASAGPPGYRGGLRHHGRRSRGDRLRGRRCLSVGNLEPVAQAVRRLFPTRELRILAADDDCHLPRNVGLEAARNAAQAIGASLALPGRDTERRALWRRFCGHSA